MANLTSELRLISQNKLFAFYAVRSDKMIGQVQISRSQLDPQPPKVLQLSVMSLVPANDVPDRR